jgi:hypothetical protein
MLPLGTWSALSLPAIPPPLSALLAALVSVVPTPVAAACTAAASTISSATYAMLSWRESHALLAVLLHGLLTDGVSDALAQALAVRREHSLVIDWQRLRRSTLVAFLSDDLPFALWARLLWDGFEALRPRLLASPLPAWLRTALASPLGVAVLKTLVSQFGYETASTAAYLGLQEAARGGDARSVWRELRAKFWRAWASGVGFFSATHLLMFLLPVWWLQPLLDNLTCLAFNTYLALLSHDHDEGEDTGSEIRR